MTAQAPSLIFEALAAVTLPFLLNTGFRVASFSLLNLLYSSSSVTTYLSTVTGTISSLNLPDFVASMTRVYDWMVKSS
jgi:hypothetical protein